VQVRLSSDYRELPPPRRLAPFVECLWTQTISEGDGVYVQPVLPDACIDLVALDDELRVAGPNTTAGHVHLLPNARTVGVRFRPGAAPALLGASASELRDAELQLRDVWGRDGERVTEQLMELSPGEHRLGVLCEALAGRVAAAREIDPVGVSIGSMLLAQPSRSLPDLADAVGLGERQLRRRVETAVGYPPRMYLRILRFQRFLAAARASRPDRHLALLAAEAGYADQAHLTRESRELTGLPPAALLEWEIERLQG
jgi:AraC-like DNA-binding protein